MLLVRVVRQLAIRAEADRTCYSSAFVEVGSDWTTGRIEWEKGLVCVSSHRAEQEKIKEKDEEVQNRREQGLWKMPSSFELLTTTKHIS